MRRFEEPSIELVEFSVEDVITTSTDSGSSSNPDAGAEDEF